VALANLADSLVDRGLHEKAIWCLREAAHLDPRLPGVHARLAAAYSATGRHERARQMYLRELRERPGCIDTLLDFGDLLAQMGRLSEASEKYRRVLEQESDNADAHLALGELALRQGSDREALAAFRIAERIDPERPGVRRRIAAALLKKGEVSDARRRLRADLRTLRAGSPAFTREDRLELGDLLLDAGLPGDAAEVFRGMVSEAPSDAAALHHLSLASFLQGEREAGARAARWALKATPAPGPEIRLAALHNLALWYYESKRWRRARACLRRAQEISADDAGLRRLRTLLRARRGMALLGRLLRRHGRSIGVG
jgi:tetratricopeptide (TPR) repeat protein